jgi:DNA-binding winged helix-turn-helix (wHTH) protein
MNNKLFGFLIDDEIQLDIRNRRLTRIYTTPEKTVLFAAVALSETMVRFLVFLLSSAKEDKLVCKEDILKQVWDEHERSSSNQRLWQTVKDLRLRFTAIGLPYDFIITAKGSYSLNNKEVTTLFCE